MHLVVNVVDIVEPMGPKNALERDKPVTRLFSLIPDILKTIFDMILWLLMLIYLYYGFTLVGLLN
jgi:hypothetical protein